MLNPVSLLLPSYASGSGGAQCDSVWVPFAVVTVHFGFFVHDVRQRDCVDSCIREHSTMAQVVMIPLPAAPGAPADAASVEYLRLSSEELPDDASGVISVLKKITPPLHLWYDVALLYYQKKSFKNFELCLKEMFSRGAPGFPSSNNASMCTVVHSTPCPLQMCWPDLSTVMRNP